MSEHVAVRLLGPFGVLVDGVPLRHLYSHKGEWLLALLALRLGRPVAREWLSAILWPESTKEQAFSYLRHALTDLRHALGPEAGLLSSPTPQTVCLLAEGVWADVARFDALVADGSNQALEEAVELYRGPLLEGCLEEWALEERAAREERCLAALETLAESALGERRPTRAIHLLRRLVAADPLREDLYRSLMEALALCGDWAAVQQTYRDLRLLLHREINAQPSAETDTLYERLRAESRRAPTLPTAPAEPLRPPRRLPVPLTQLVGREHEIREVVDLVPRERLVMLTGSGGVGKTRLAIAVGEVLLAEPELADALCPDGVWMVELAPLSDPSLVSHQAARALGVAEQPGVRVLDTLAKALRGRRLVLIMDNCEHLLGACAELVEGLLTACAGVRVLATGRQPLGMAGETTYRVPSLPVPEAGATHAVTGEQALEYGAVRLFAERAAAAQSAFQVTDTNAQAVAQVCRRLDGIPLAIEMAAARVRALPVEQMAERLDDGFRPLLTGSRTAPARHQTLRAAIDWSYDLLTEPERTLLGRLSVFAGGWTLDAAEAVCADDADDADDADAPVPDPKSGIRNEPVLCLLASLVDKSLVLYEERENGQGRYRLLETIRQYARDRLGLTGESARVRERHWAFCLALAEACQREMWGPRFGWWLARLETEHDNMRAALETSSGVRRLCLASALAKFWEVRGHLTEGRARLERVLEECEGLEAPDPARAWALLVLGNIAFRRAECGLATALAEEALALFRRTGNRRDAAYATGGLGVAALCSGDLGRAEGWLAEGLAMAKEMRDPRLVSFALSHLGWVKLYSGDEALPAARAYFQESLEPARQCGMAVMVSYAQFGLATVLRLRGDYAGALPLLRESLSIRHKVQQTPELPDLLENIAFVAASCGQGVRAARLLGAASILREDLVVPVWPVRRAGWERDVGAVRAALRPDEFAAAWAEGRAMSSDEAAVYALADDEVEGAQTR